MSDRDVVLDDFASDASRPTAWTVFTDRVMGGVSDAQGALTEVQGRRALRLTGRVSLERNGGFVQMARALGPGGALFDARPYTGLALSVCGTPGPYFVHLRTADTRAPWQYYGATLAVIGYVARGGTTVECVYARVARGAAQRVGVAAHWHRRGEGSVRRGRGAGPSRAGARRGGLSVPTACALRDARGLPARDRARARTR